MSPGPESTTRRHVLGLAGASLGTVAFNSAVADPADPADPADRADSADAARLNVGYSSPSGKQAATALADEVVYDFGFDAVTIRAAASARETLARRSDVRYAEPDGEMHAIGATSESTCETGSQPYT